MPLEIHKSEVDWSQMPTGMTWYIIGAPKTGKTTQTAKWSDRGLEGVLLLDTDLGSDFVNGCQSLTITSLNPPERVKLDLKGNPVIGKDGNKIVEEVPPLERGFIHRTGENKGKPRASYSLAEAIFDLMDNWDSYNIDTVVVDTVDEVNGWIEKEIAPNGMGEDFGKSYSKSSEKNINTMQLLQTLIKQKGATLILISHAKKSVEVDGKVQLMPALPSGLAGRMCAKADVIGYTTIDKKTGEHMISFVGYDERSVGSRIKPLHGKTVKFSYEAIKAEITGYKE